MQVPRMNNEYEQCILLSILPVAKHDGKDDKYNKHDDNSGSVAALNKQRPLTLLPPASKLCEGSTCSLAIE